jgi:hypothetical protein
MRLCRDVPREAPTAALDKDYLSRKSTGASEGENITFEADERNRSRSGEITTMLGREIYCESLTQLAWASRAHALRLTLVRPFLSL